jgi:hypothetical protein
MMDSKDVQIIPLDSLSLFKTPETLLSSPLEQETKWFAPEDFHQPWQGGIKASHVVLETSC